MCYIQEPIFPPSLQLSPALDQQLLHFPSHRLAWWRPVTLNHLLRLRHAHPAAKIVTGNTELGVEVKFKGCEYPVYLQPGQVPELNSLTVGEEGVVVGAAVTLTRLEDLCDSLASSKPASQLRVFTQIKEMLRWFAGKQIRNVAAVGGNIMTGSPISDLNPIFLAAGCTLEIRSYTGPTKRVAFNEKFYTGYRRNILQPDEVLVSLTIPFTSPSQHFVAYKQSKRRDDDIAIVNSAFWLDLQAGAVKQIRIAFGGVAPVTKLALETCSALKGEQWSRDLVDKAAGALLLEFPLPPDVPGAMVRYRQSLILR